MTAFVATVASLEGWELAEGPGWDAVGHRVLWVDILGGTVFEGRLHGDQVETHRMHCFAGGASVVVPASDGGLLVAAGDRLVVVATDGRRSAGPVIVPELG